MDRTLSPRLAAIIDALPLKKGFRVLEVGCGPGAAAREVANRIGMGYVLAIDRSEKAIRQAIAGSSSQIGAGRLAFRKIAIEDFDLALNEEPFDLAFGIRVGALDGRHPDVGERALEKIAAALTKSGRLFIDGGKPLKEIQLTSYR